MAPSMTSGNGPDGPAPECPGTDLVAWLERWETFGATWQVVARSQDSVTVALCRCDGGEEVERFSSTDQEFLNYVDAHDPAGTPTPDA
jgi:hypothetical protein